jgi:hypothetical protein
MRTVTYKHSAFLILILAGLVSVIAAVYTNRALAQGNTPGDIKLRRANYEIDDAVRIVGARLDGNYYDFEKSRELPPISTTSGWLERLQFVVKNTSPKVLIAGTIRIECPSINHGPRDQMIFDEFTLGIVPDRFRYSSGPPQASLDTTRPPISVQPSQEATFVLGSDFDRMRKKLPQSGPFPDCTVEPMAFHFSDGTYWVRRHFYKPDPNSDHGYIEISPKDFGLTVPAY